MFNENQMFFEERERNLEECGIAGEVMHTPGRSEDSITLCLDEGADKVFLEDGGENVSDTSKDKHSGDFGQDRDWRLLSINDRSHYQSEPIIKIGL